ncbi:MAG TPA: hypothetical protein VEA61_10505 [Allosphingosinicella sp.]|nr:hypothetical protein [Allosphingosinicella sp.]
MERAGSGTLLAMLAAALAGGCGDETTRGRALAETVARDFRKECETAAAPDAAMRRHLERPCACGEAKIAATPMRFGESDASVGAKVRAATKACHEAPGGAPGEKRR